MSFSEAMDPPEGNMFSSIPATYTYGNSRPLEEWTVMRVILLVASSPSSMSTALRSDTFSRYSSRVTAGRSEAAISAPSPIVPSACICSKYSLCRSSTKVLTLFRSSSTLAALDWPSMLLSLLYSISRPDSRAIEVESVPASSLCDREENFSIMSQNTLSFWTAAGFRP